MLHIDHITAVANGGDNNIVNLITACDACNLGKGAVALDDKSAAVKQMKQLKLLNERREQIQMIAEWRTDLLGVEDQEVGVMERYIKSLCGFGLSEAGKANIRKALKKYGLDAVLTATDGSAGSYLKTKSDEEVEKFINYIPRVAYCNEQKKTKPELERFSHICNLAAKKRFKVSRSELWNAVSNAFYNDGIDAETMLGMVRESTGIMNFYSMLSNERGERG